MTKLPLFAALAVLLSASAPALAEGNGIYSVGLETPVTTVAIVRDTRWACAGATCSAQRSATSPDANVCASVARRLGRLTRFAVDDREFDATALERCNAVARATN